MAYLYAWTTASPVLTDLVHDGAQEIREGVKAALNERIQSIVANIDNDPWQLKNIQAAVNNTYDIGTITSRFKAGYVNALAVNIGVVPSAGNILLANTGVVQSRNAAGLGNLNMLSMSASDVLQLYNGAATLTSVGVMTATTFVGNLTGNADTATTVSGNAATATKLLTARTINGVSFDGTANITVSAATVGTLTFGTHLTSGAASFSGANATITSDATNLNTISTIVARDGSGNFSAGTITAALTGNVTGNCSGTAATVTTAAQPAITSVGTLTGLTVTATITGSVSGSAATVTTAAQPAITSVGTLTSLAVTGAITAGTFGGVTMSSGAVSGITTLAGTGAVSGFTTAAFSSTVTVTSNSADMVLNGSSGATSNVERLLFQRGGANKWRVGVNMEGGNADVFGVFSDAAGIYAITASAATGNIFFGASATVTSGFTVSAGTTAVQALTTAGLTTFNESIILGTAGTTANPGTIRKNATDGVQHIAITGATNDWTLYNPGATGNPIIAVPTGTVNVTFRGGISCTTGTFSGGAGGASITMPATGRFYVDGGGDTYIVESAANQLDLIVGTIQVIRMNTTDIFLSIGATVSAANVNWNGATGSLKSVSSSMRFKTGVTNLTLDDAAKLIFGSRPVSFRSSIASDDASIEYLGFIAEEIDLLDPRLCFYQNDSVHGLQYDRFIVPAVVVLQDHERRLQQLEHAALA